MQKDIYIDLSGLLANAKVYNRPWVQCREYQCSSSSHISNGVVKKLYLYCGINFYWKGVSGEIRCLNLVPITWKETIPEILIPNYKRFGWYVFGCFFGPLVQKRFVLYRKGPKSTMNHNQNRYSDNRYSDGRHSCQLICFMNSWPLTTMHTYRRPWSVENASTAGRGGGPKRWFTRYMRFVFSNFLHVVLWH
jgi:hypothetical protein